MTAQIFLHCIFLVIREKDELYILSLETVTFIKKPLNLLNVLYHPASCLLLHYIHNISKLIEKLFYNRLANQNKCLYHDQFGFWNHHSTNHALKSITEKMWNALDYGKYACGIFLDFQKAFDIVNHRILLSRLKHYIIRGMPLKLF